MSIKDTYSVEVDDINRSEWEAILSEFDDATIYQTWSYGAVRWGENNLSHLVLREGNEIISIAQVTIKKIPGMRAGIAYVPWGPLWQRKGNEIREEIFRSIINAMKNEYAKERGLLIRIDPNVYGDLGNSLKSVLEQCAFTKQTNLGNYRTLVVDLFDDLNEIRKKLNPKWRNKLNGAEKNKLIIVEGTSDQLYQVFHKLQQEMEGRKEYIPGVDYDEFRAIQNDLPEHLKMKIVVCESEGECVACTLVTAIGSTGIYILGATGNKGLKTKGSYLVHWHIIGWLKEKGYKYYDLGGINPENNPGVYTFKSGLSGIDISHIGQYEYSESNMSNIVVKLGEMLK